MTVALRFRSVVLIDDWAFASSGLLNVTVPTSVTFVGQVVLSLRMISINSLKLTFNAHALCMLVRILLQQCTGKRVSADFVDVDKLCYFL